MYVGVKVDEGVSVDIMADVAAKVGVSVGTTKVSVKGWFGSIVGVEVGVSTVEVGLTIICRIVAVGVIATITAQIVAIARTMAKMT